MIAKVYFIETYSSSITMEADSHVVALTPKACYQLDKAGIGYSIIDDYYTMEEMLASEDEHYAFQISWLHAFDQLLWQSIPELKEIDLKPASLYYPYIKAYILDPLYIRCYAVSAAIKAIQPKELIFVLDEPKPSSLNITLEDKSQNLYSKVVSLVCKRNGIEFITISVESQKTDEVKSIRNDVTVLNKVKRTLNSSSLTIRVPQTSYQRIRFVKSYLRRRQSRKTSGSQKLSIIAIRSKANIWPDVLTDILRHGHNCYLLRDNDVLQLSLLREKRFRDMGIDSIDGTDETGNVWQQTADLLDESDLITQLCEWCQLNVFDIALPKLKFFITDICPEISKYYKSFLSLFHDERYDLVISSFMMGPVDHAALAAANHEGLTTVHLDHGCDAYSVKFRTIHAFENFSVFISPSKEIKESWQEWCKKKDIQSDHFCSPHQFSSIERTRQLRTRQIHPTNKRQRIIYLNGFFTGDSRLRMERNFRPDTWYFRFQRLLVDYFATKTEYTFVWKGLPQSDKNFNPIPNFIADNEFDNIEIATNPFVEHLLSADRVICDRPSTGFYQSIIAGIPTMSLYWGSHAIRPSAIEQFGNTLKPFTDITEAKQHIDEFLNSDPELYVANIELGESSILDILEEVARKYHYTTYE